MSNSLKIYKILRQNGLERKGHMGEGLYVYAHVTGLCQVRWMNEDGHSWLGFTDEERRRAHAALAQAEQALISAGLHVNRVEQTTPEYAYAGLTALDVFEPCS